MIHSQDKLQMNSALVLSSGLTSDVLSLVNVTPDFLTMACLRFGIAMKCVLTYSDHYICLAQCSVNDVSLYVCSNAVYVHLFTKCF
jgi:hypothetical protein